MQGQHPLMNVQSHADIQIENDLFYDMKFMSYEAKF